MTFISSLFVDVSVSSLYNSIKNNGTQWVGTLLIFGLFIFCVVYGYNLYLRYMKVREEKSKLEDVSNKLPSADEVSVLFFFADWCPACQRAKPAWEDFMKKYDKTNATIKGRRVACRPMDCTNNKDRAVKDQLSLYNIRGFPTIVLVSGTKNIQMDTSISVEKIEKFIEDILTAA